MNLKLGLIMFFCIVPFLILIFLVVYPKNWPKKKVIFGVKNRDEFKTPDIQKRVDEIVMRARKQALYILIPAIIISVLLILIPNITVMLIIYTVYIMLILVVFYFPYIKGNSELKSLKREMGIEAKGVRVADLQSISSAHALNMPMIIIPNAIAGAVTLLTFLYDLELFSVPSSKGQGSFVATILSLTFLSMGILFIVLAKMMDNMRNEVISEESDVNANFNRAKKKMWSDVWIQISWLNTIMLIYLVVVMLVLYSEGMLLVGSVAYMIAICVILGIMARKTALLNSCYKFEGGADDDDDNWIYGIFYYNPKDYRLNIERRDGLGTTINMAHPLGKVISIAVALTLIGTFASLIWAGAVEGAALDVRIEDGKVICHQLRDEYVIPESEIRDVYLGDDMEELDPIRIAGVATDKVLKGRYSVGEVKQAKLFMNPNVDLYIKITTDETTYYINANSEDETRELYEELQ